MIKFYSSLCSITKLCEMLKKLDGKAPKVAMDQIAEFKEYSWKPLSSYVHGGFMQCAGIVRSTLYLYYIRY